MKKALGVIALVFLCSLTTKAQQTASQQLTLTVNAQLVITTTTLPPANVNQPYSTTINYTGGSAPYSCTITAGALPTGLTLGTTGSNGSCTLSGTPTNSGSFSFTIEVVDGGTHRVHIGGVADVPRK